MAETTKIEWVDKTWSPWTGCAKVSPACDGCYAAHLMDTRMHRVKWGEPGAGDGTRDIMSDSYWQKPLAWDRAAAKSGERPTVFPSLCDPFDLAVPAAWRARFFELMERTPHLTWLLLTKRIGNVIKLTVKAPGARPLPKNAALGGTFANQDEWDRDWRKLRDAYIATGALFTFGSFEPLLSHILFSGEWMPHWVIAGGETDQGDHKARPTPPSWFQSLRDQCVSAGVPFLFKQWGSHLPGDMSGESETGGPAWILEEEHCGVDWDDLGKGTEVEAHGQSFIHFGHKNTGRLLDGRTWDQFPKVSP